MPRPPSSSSPLTVWRVAQGLSQQAIAAKLKVNPSTVGDWERGKALPRLEQALALELLSNGEVPIESYGYGPKVVHLLVSFRTYLLAADPDRTRARPRARRLAAKASKPLAEPS